MAKTKAKKRKLTHAHPYAHTNDHARNSTNSIHELSHDQIWDDSALIRSWDEAVAEYEFYHSINARGEDVDEVLKQSNFVPRGQMGDEDGNSATERGFHGDDGPYGANPGKDSFDEDGEIPNDDANEDELGATDLEAYRSATITHLERDHSNDIAPIQPESVPAKEYVAPSGIISTSKNSFQTPQNVRLSVDVQNQTLENIKMAYYWAGYYSGLYDGQRQSQISPPNASTLAGNKANVEKGEGEA